MPISNGQLAWTNRYFHAPEEAQTAVEVEIPPKDPVNPYEVKLRQKKKKPKPEKPTQTKVTPFVTPPAGKGTPSDDSSRDNDDDDDKEEKKKKKRRRRLLAIILGVLAGLLLLAAILIALCFTGVICGSEDEIPPVPDYLANALSGGGTNDQCMGDWNTHFMVYNVTHHDCVIDVDVNNKTSYLSVSYNAAAAANLKVNDTELRCCYNHTRSLMVSAGSYSVPSDHVIIPDVGTPDYPITCPQFCIDDSLTECCRSFGPEVCHKYNPGLCNKFYPPYPPGYNPNSAPSLGSVFVLLPLVVGSASCL